MHFEYVAGLCLLDRFSTSRSDTDGIADVDLEAASHPHYHRWERQLSNEDKAWLAVWRGGAVKTPTLRWFGKAATCADILNARLAIFGLSALA